MKVLLLLLLMMIHHQSSPCEVISALKGTVGSVGANSSKCWRFMAKNFSIYVFEINLGDQHSTQLNVFNELSSEVLFKGWQPNYSFRIKSARTLFQLNTSEALDAEGLKIDFWQIETSAAPQNTSLTTIEATNSSQMLQNYGFPSFYGNNSLQKWNILAPLEHIIKYKLQLYNIEECHLCQCDRVTIIENDNDSLTQCQPESQLVLKSTSNHPLLEFKTDETITPVSSKTGFTFKYQAVKNFAKNFTQNRYIRIQASSFHRQTLSIAYENNYDCIWEIFATATSKIRYSIATNWIEYCTNCSCDYVIVSENLLRVNQSEPDVRFRDCGESASSTGLSLTRGNRLFVRFVTDGSMTAPEGRFPFKIEYEEIPETFCQTTNVLSGLAHGTIRNLEYPAMYHRDVRCQWLIRVSNGAKIRLTVQSHWMDLCSTRNCSGCGDYLTIKDGQSFNDDTLGSVCKTNESLLLTSTSNSALLYFHTDSKYNYRIAENETAGFTVTFQEYWDSSLLETSEDIKNVYLSTTSIVAALMLVSIVTAVMVSRYMRKSKLLIASRKQSSENHETALTYLNNYIQPASNFQELLDEFGNDELREMMQRLSIEPEWLSIDHGTILGNGQFGLVHKAILNRPNSYTELVAVKSLKSSRSEDMVDFLKEAFLMQTFDHPNILVLIGVSVVFGQPRVVIPLMARGNLKNYFSKAKLEVIRIRHLIDFCHQICSGMAYLSARKCIHRDLACRNILVSSELVLKISDFGMARHVRKEANGYYVLRETNSQLLPVRWHPPESLLYSTFEPKSDVWSFGIVCWEIFNLCEKEPYEHISVADLVRKVCNGLRPDQPAMCPDLFYQCIMTPCWRENRKDRPSFEDLLSDIRRYEDSTFCFTI